MQAWEWQNPTPQGHLLWNAHVVDQDLMLAVGENGTVLRTQDGGHSWDATHCVKGHEDFLCAVEFVDRDHGWITGYNGTILRTENGGQSWTDLSVDSFPGFEDVDFVDDSTGWAAGGGPGVVIHTEDAGNTWSVDTPSGSGILTSVSFIDDSTGWVSGSKGLFRTTNGGATWGQLSTNGFPRIQFANDSLGWGLNGTGFGSSLWRTDDGGQTWNNVLSTNAQLNGFHFVDDSLGWVVGENKIFRTQDGGSTWETVHHSVALPGMFTVHASGPEQRWAAGQKGVLLKGEVGERDWEPLWKDRNIPGLQGAHFPSSSVGYVAGGGKVFKTQQGGSEWMDVSPSTGSYSLPPIHDVFFLDENQGWVAASGELVFHTDDGGMHWEKDSLPISGGDLNALHFVDKDHGWAVNGQGRIARTQDGGDSWSVKSKGNFPAFRDVHFSDADHGWVVGVKIYRTQNGGDDWVEASIDSFYVHGEDVHFIDDSEGWMVGHAPGNGMIFHTSNGGQDWELQDTVPHALRDVHFVNDSQGYVVGRRGGIYHTSDGGSGWVQQKAPEPGNNYHDLTAVHFSDPQHGWTVGADGWILHYDGTWSSVQRKEKEKRSALSVYPNPASERLVVEWSSSEGRGSVELQLYDPFGKLVKERILSYAPSSKKRWNLSLQDLASGLYILRAKKVGSGSERSYTKKVVVR